MIDIKQLTSDLREDEGEVLHAYQDHRGFWTIGVGILIDKRGGGIDKEESEWLLAHRIAKKRAELIRALPWLGELDDVRQGALLNMAFQMGVQGLMGFVNSLRMIREKRWVEAGENLKKSKWYAQTPARAMRVIKAIVTGAYRGT